MGRFCFRVNQEFIGGKLIRAWPSKLCQKTRLPKSYTQGFRFLPQFKAITSTPFCQQEKSPLLYEPRGDLYYIHTLYILKLYANIIKGGV